MPRLRLKLLKDFYLYRWELLGTYTLWKPGFSSRLKTVELAYDELRKMPQLGD